jgi:hypothetical protein
MALTEVAENFEGLTFWRGNPGYEQARRANGAATWLEDCRAIRWA